MKLKIKMHLKDINSGKINFKRTVVSAQTWSSEALPMLYGRIPHHHSPSYAFYSSSYRIKIIQHNIKNKEFSQGTENFSRLVEHVSQVPCFELPKFNGNEIVLRSSSSSNEFACFASTRILHNMCTIAFNNICDIYRISIRYLISVEKEHETSKYQPIEIAFTGSYIYIHLLSKGLYTPIYTKIHK